VGPAGVGRKKSLSDEQVQEMRQKRSEGLKIKDLMTHFALSKASVYRALSEHKNINAM